MTIQQRTTVGEFSVDKIFEQSGMKFVILQCQT